MATANPYWSACEFLATPISSPGCEYAYGIYPESHECSTYYIKCAGGEPHQSSCEPGLAYDDRIHGCNWPDKLLEICNPEGRLSRIWKFYLTTTEAQNINIILMYYIWQMNCFSCCRFLVSSQSWSTLSSCPFLAIPKICRARWSSSFNYMRRGSSTSYFMRWRTNFQRRNFVLWRI